MTKTLDQICQEGGFLNAYLYHICGMPWAATNSVEFKEFLDGDSTEALSLKTQMFGDSTTFNDVQILSILGHDLGSQSASYDESKGLTVGPWSVSLSSDPSGFVWQNGAGLEQWGVLGLDWQPHTGVDGAKYCTPLYDIVPDLTTNTVYLSWPENKDFGMSQWMLDNIVTGIYTEQLYIYVSCACLRPVFPPTLTDGVWSVRCQSAQFNAPNEDIRAVKKGQSIYATNFPQGIAGLTANLYGVQFDHNAGTVSGGGFGHDYFGHFPFGHTTTGGTGNLLSGTKPFFVRSGKIKANATTGTDGAWSIQMGGVTEQFKFAADNSRFSGTITGYNFCRNQSPYFGLDRAFSSADISVREVFDSGLSNVTSIQLENTAYNNASSVEDLRSKIVNALNDDATTDCIYSLDSSGDIIWAEPSGVLMNCVYVTGPAILAAGVGYVGYNRLWPWISMLTDPMNSNAAINEVGRSEPLWTRHLPYDTVQLADTLALCLRPADVEVWEFKTGDYNTFEVSGLVRNEAYFEYFFAYDLGRNLSSAQNSSNNERLTGRVAMVTPITYDPTKQSIPISATPGTEIALDEGDKISFGTWDDGWTIDGEVSSISGQDVDLVADTIYGMPSAMYWCKSLPTVIRSDSTYRSELQAALDMANRSASGIGVSTVDDLLALFDGGDPFAVSENTQVNVDSPTDILRQLIGDPDVDTGLTSGIIQTGIKNIVQRGDVSNFVPFVDWDTLESLFDASKIIGTSFRFAAEESVDWSSLLYGFCITHGIEMTWEYTELYRCWWISFKKFNDGNLVSATQRGNVITESDISENGVRGMVGGSWYYTGIKCAYRTTGGDKVNADYSLSDGRIGHTLSGKELQFSDDLTFIPAQYGDYTEALEQIENLHYATMLQAFSQVTYKQSVALNMTKASRVGVGLWSAIEWDALLLRDIGKRGAGKVVGEVASISTNLSTMKQDIEIIATAGDAKGIGPALGLDYSAASPPTTSGDTVTFQAVDTDSTEFANGKNGQSDLSMFGCFDYVGGQLAERVCSCGGFRVTVFERNTEALYFDDTYTDTGQNVWRGTMQALDLGDISGNVSTGVSSIDIELDGNIAAFDTTADYIVIFADRADALLQQCQTELFGWLGDSNGQVEDSDGNTKAAIKVGA